ncbi:MAG: Holliday junction resolvase RuvX [Caldisericia bacterium]|nr:Holliday junction resolvase RuvX [Caldisericia bacterium]
MIIAFDYGTKNIGVAATDDEEIFSFAKCSIPTKDFNESSDVLIMTVPQIKDARILVVGHPKNLKNCSTQSTENAVEFSEKLQDLFPDKNVILFDERLTSSLVNRAMNASGPKKRTKKKTIENRNSKDMLEAQIILQDYLKSKET